MPLSSLGTVSVGGELDSCDGAALQDKLPANRTVRDLTHYWQFEERHSSNGPKGDYRRKG